MPEPSLRSPKLIQLAVGDLCQAMWEWPGEDPPLLFVHATGFHGRCWDQVIRLLPGQRRCLALDSRGHGRSSKPAPPYRWPFFAKDLHTITEQLQISDAIGIGHSMGAHTITSVASSRPASFSQLLLLDPTIRRPDQYGIPPFDASFIRRRRVRWESPDAMWESFRARSPFDRWNPAVLRDYCDYGLLPDGGGYVLACPPEAEASVYENSREAEASLHSVIPSITQPVVVLRAGSVRNPLFNSDPSPTDPQLAARFPHGRDVMLRELSHYIPMEAPELVAKEIWGLLGRSVA